MAATTLSAGDIAIIGYQADSPDALSFVLLRDIGSGTQIFFSDRNWNGSAFPGAGSGDGTVTYTAGADLVAGTVVTINAASLSGGGSTFDHTTGDTIYAYQGTNANTPTTFLYAVDFGDGNTTFNGNLAGTGLTNGVNAVAVSYDNASYAGPSTFQAGLQLSTGSNLLTDISNFNEWIGNDNAGQTALVQPPQTVMLDAPEVQVWTVGSGGGEVIAHVNNNNGSNTGTNIVALLTNKTINIVKTGGTVADAAGLRGTQDIALDPVHNKYFVLDSDGTNDRILEGNLSDLLNNPGATQTLRQLYAQPAVGDGGTGLLGLTVDPNNGILYFIELGGTTGNDFRKVTYNVSGGASTVDQVPVTLGSIGIEGTNFPQDVAVDFVNGDVVITDGTTFSVFGSDAVFTNYVWRATGLTAASGAGSLTFNKLNFAPDDDDAGAPNNANVPGLSGEAFPVERGVVFGVDIDPVTRTLYFTTESIALDTSAAQDGSVITTFFGGVWSYALTGNATGTYTNIYQQNGSGITGLLHYIEVDQSGNYYVTGKGTGSEAIYIDSVVAGGAAPTKFADITNINGLGPHGLVLDYAPTLLLALGATPTYTETAGSPSAAGTAVSLNITATANDIDAVDTDEDLAGAVVRISNGFQSGASHQDFLTVNGDADGVGTIGGSGISFSYNSTLGVLTLSGTATFAEYKAALELVQFTSSGDNPTNYGANTTRTVSWSVNDGLLSSSEQTSTINITAVNDNPINNSLPTLNGAGSVTEDTGKQIVFSVSDVDADPANQNITVRLQVTNGTIDINAAVAGGLTAGQITGDNTNDVLLTGTQNQINATLANATGAVYHNTADYNGADTLIITTNDLGNTGTPGAAIDMDILNININAVVDIANDPVTVGEDSGANTLSLLANDTFENPGRAITAVGPASHGTVTINNNGTAGDATDDFVQYTAVADYNGSDSFTYTVTSGGVTEQATVNVTVTAVADIVNDTVVVNEDSGANSLNLLANDTFENPSRAITAVGAALHGTTSINNNGTAGDATDDFVVYTPNTNYNGSDTFTYTVTSPAGVTEQATVNVTVNAVNDPVTSSAPANAAVVEDVATAITGLSISDVDTTLAPAGIYSVTLTATNGTLSLGAGTLGALSFTSGDGTADATMTFTGTLANINTALATATYASTLNFNGSATISIAVTDDVGGTIATGLGTATSDSDNINVTVSAANDPVTSTAPANASGAEDAVAIAITGLSIADVDATLAPAGIYSVTLSATNGTLSLTTLTGLSFTAGDGTADATMTFTGSLSDINTALATAGYAPAPNFNGSATVSISVTDDVGGTIATGSGVATSDSDNVNVTVTATNDSVTSTAPANAAVVEDVATAITGLSISDVDATLAPAGIYSVTLTATNGTLSLGAGTLGALSFTSGDGTADATMTFTGTLANINTALATATYASTLNFNGSATISIAVTDDVGGTIATGSGTATSDSDNINVTVSAANDPVTSTAPANASGAEDGGAIAITGLSISDVDATLAPAGIYSVTLTATNGSLTLTTLTGLSFTAGDGTDDATMTFTGTLADINTALATAGYTPALNFNGPATVSISVTDDVGGTIATGSGVATSDSDNVNVNVTATNDAPEAVIDQTTYLGSPGVDVDLYGELSVSDVDAGAGSVTVTLSVDHGTLTVTAGGSGAGVAGSGTATVTITGTVAQINDLLNTDATSTVSFNDPAPVGPITLTLAVDDNGLTGTPGNLTGQDVATINLSEPPVIAGLGGDTGNFTEGGSAVFLDNPATAATVTDADSTDFDGGNLTATITNLVATEDFLSIATEVGVVELSDNTNVGSDVTVNGVLIGTIAAGGTGLGGEPLIVSLNSAATPALVGILVQHLVYSNSNNINPDLTTRSIDVSIDDGTGASDTETVTVSITPTNDGPSALIGPPSYNATEQTALDLKAAGLSVNDGDADTGSVTVTLSVTEGTLTVTAGGSGAGVAGSGTSTVTLTGTIAQINDLLTSDATSTVSYTDGSDNPSASATLTLAINDNGNTGGGNLTAQDTATINITAVNDDPAATIAPPTYNATENITLNLKTNGLAVSDIDGNAGNMTVTLSVTEGTLNVQAGSSGAIVSGSPGTSVTITGTLTQINALLNTDGTSVVQYTETDNSPSATVTLTLAIDDNGNTGGGNLTAQDTATINITPANDAPTATITPASYSATENITLNLKTNGLSVSDASDGNLGSMTVTLSVTEGTLTVAAGGSGAGVAGSGTSSVTITGTVAQINALLDTDGTSVVQYTETDDSPSATATLTLAINDNGNTGGGNLTAQDTATINITPANDAPTATITPPTYNATENITLNLKTNGLSVSDASDGNLGSMTVTLSVTEGTLNVAAGSSGAIVSGSPGASVTITGTVAQINSLLNTDGTSVVQYTETDDTPSAAVTLTLAINDNGNTGGGPGLTAQDTATINITPSNDLPVVGNLTPSITYLIAAPPQTLSSGATVTDPDSANLTSASVTLTDHQAGDELSVNGVLNNAVGVNGITWTYTAATGVLLLLGSSSLANYQALLDQVQYRSTSGDPSNGGTTTSRDVAWSVNDGSDPSVTQHTAISVGNQAPTVDLNGGGAGTNADQLYTENVGTQPVANASLTLADADDSNLVSATIVLTNAKPGDTLSIGGSLPGGITSAIDTSVAGQITVTLSGNAARSTYQTAIQQVLFSNPTDNPDATDRIITVSVNDGQDSSNNAILTVHVNSLNDAPANVVPATQEIEANTSTAISGLAVTDPDAASGSMTTTLSVQHGTLTVASAGGAAVSGSGTATVTLTGTLAAINTTLAAANNVVYKGALDFFGNDTLTVNTNDNGNSAVPPGGAQADTDLVALHLNTLITGTPGNDSYNALPGQERIDAGLGLDTITFNFKLVDASVKYVGNTVIIDGPTGSHTVLTGFEVFNFTDGTVNNNDGSPLIDDLFYYSRYHDVWNAHADADAHYNTFGWHEGRNPDAFFQTAVYLSANPDVKASGVNPLTHFDITGWKEGRVPSITFDPAQYLNANPDVQAANIDPLRHYLANGFQEGRQPFAPSELVTANGFDYVYYLNNNPDVAGSGVDPFLHFQTVGWKEGRNPNALFDTNGYLNTYLDVKAANINPLDHYNTNGWIEGRDPSVGFDTTSYLGAYADVNAAHVNPLTHFLHYGIHEGRSPFADGVWG